MGLDEAISLIGSLGFPIVACIALFLNMQKQDENHRKEVDELRISISELKDVISKNTEVMNILVSKLG